MSSASRKSAAAADEVTVALRYCTQYSRLLIEAIDDYLDGSNILAESAIANKLAAAAKEHKGVADALKEYAAAAKSPTGAQRARAALPK